MKAVCNRTELTDHPVGTSQISLAPESHWGLVQTRLMGPSPRVSNSVAQRWSPKICFSIKLQTRLLIWETHFEDQWSNPSSLNFQVRNWGHRRWRSSSKDTWQLRSRGRIESRFLPPHYSALKITGNNNSIPWRKFIHCQWKYKLAQGLVKVIRHNIVLGSF